jgi:hypothetical protein
VQFIDAEKPVEEQVVMPAFVHVSGASRGENEKGAYQSLEVVVSRPDLFADALAQLVAKVHAAQAAATALEHAARQSGASDRLALVAMATKALEAAASALHAMH